MLKINIKQCIAIVLIAIIALITFAFSIESLNHIINFNGSAANGAFQLMNPLTRLASGQIIGKDFQFFHGAGVALIHYPLFVLFGEGLFGSEMSRWFTSIILFLITGFLFCYMWFRDKDSRFNISLLAFVTTFFFSALFAEAITPSNSLLGIRTTFPILIGVFLLLRPSIENKYLRIKSMKIGIFNLLLGTLLALAVLFGTEHGIAAIIAFLIVEFIQRTVVIKHKSLKDMIQTFGNLTLKLLPVMAYMIVLLFTLSTIISHGHPLALLHYSLVIVPDDQFWYFGAEPQGYLQLNVIFQQLINPTMFPLYIIVTCSMIIFFVARKLHLLTRNEWLVVAFLVIYGLITLGSLLGYYSPTSQIVGILRVFILIDSILITLMVIKLLRSDNNYAKVSSIAACVLILSAVGVLSISKLNEFNVRKTIRDTYHNIKGDHSTLLGAAWTERIAIFQPYIDDAKKQDSLHPLWSTYASIYERQNNIIHPSSYGCDYIIHCLGEDMRNQYVQDFINDKPELAITLRQSYFGFEEWLWGRHATFYQHLSDNYEIVAENDSHILWKRTEKPYSPRQDRSLAVSSSSITLPSTSVAGSQVIRVSVEYKTDEKWSKLPFLNKMPRYMLRPINTTSKIGFSVPPTQHNWSFLVVLNNDASASDQYLEYTADGLLPRSHMIVTKATYSPVNVSARNLPYFTEQSVLLK